MTSDARPRRTENWSASSWETSSTVATRFEWDSNNNPTKVSLPTGAASSAFYKPEECGAATTSGTATDLQLCGVDDAGNKQAYSYDLVGNQTEAKDSTGGATIKKTYAKPGSTDIATNCSSFAGQLCSVTDGNGHVTRYLYDKDRSLKLGHKSGYDPAAIAAVIDAKGGDAWGWMRSQIEDRYPAKNHPNLVVVGVDLDVY